jgi:hypothetical protein
VGLEAMANTLMVQVMQDRKGTTITGKNDKAFSAGKD